MYCPSCGQEIPDESRFCQHCGESIAPSVDGKEEGEKKGFAFLHGLAGLIGGGIVTIFALLWFSSTQYVFPTQAAIAIWLFLIGLGITVLAPAWYWVGRPMGATFGGINPIRALQSITEDYSRKQKTIGYTIGGLLVIFSSESYFQQSTPLVIKIILMLVTVTGFFIVFMGIWHGGAVLMESIWKHD